MSEPVIHPKIQALQKHLDNIDAYLRTSKFTEFLYEARLTLMEVSPNDRDPEIVKAVDRELYLFVTTRAPSINRQRGQNNQFYYIKLAERISDLLWTRKYFNADKYGESRDLKSLREATGETEEETGEEEDSVEG